MHHKMIPFLIILSLIGCVFLSETKDVRIWIYFSPTADLASYLVDMLDYAKISINGAFFNIEDSNVIDSLILAKRRGISVRLVTDNDYSSSQGVARLINAGIPVVDDNKRSSLMHNKFLIVDNRFILTGSYNPTRKDLLNDNNAIKIDSPDLARIYLDEFNELFSCIFGGGRKTQENKVYVGDTLIECYFAPEDDPKDKILEKINKAKESIHFAIYSFSDKDYSYALIKRFNKGVIVNGIVDNTASGGSEAVRILYDAGIDVLRSHPLGDLMHHKFIIIDMETVITGSFNLTKASNKENDENVLIIHDSDIAKTYYAEFNRLYMRSPKTKDVKKEISYVYTKPNPARSKTTIAYNLSLYADRVKIRIYDVSGDLVKMIDDAPSSPGHNEFVWDLTNDKGMDLANGVYIIQIEAISNGSPISGFTKIAILR